MCSCLSIEEDFNNDIDIYATNILKRIEKQMIIYTDQNLWYSIIIKSMFINNVKNGSFCKIISFRK